MVVAPGSFVQRGAGMIAMPGKLSTPVAAAAVLLTLTFSASAQTDFDTVRHYGYGSPHDSTVVVIVTKKERKKVLDPNRNRAGLRLYCGTYWGPPAFSINDTLYKPVTTGDFGPGYDSTMLFTSGPLVHLDLSVIFKAGPFIAITIGPSFTWQNMTSIIESSINTNDARLEFMYGSAGPHFDVTYVKRILPCKINAGIFWDIGYSWWSSTLESTGAGGSSIADETVLGMQGNGLVNFAWAFGVGAGARGGIEYVFRERFGINLDFTFQYNVSSFQFDNLYNGGILFDAPDRDRHLKLLTGYSSDDHPVFTVELPKIGCSMGINWYF